MVYSEELSRREGSIVYRLHKVRERDRKFVKEKKKEALRKYGRLRCEICAFDFLETYGKIGEDFIECHHKVALSELDGESLTILDDLILVCPNCHRMLHKGISIENLKYIVDHKRLTS